MVLTTLRLIHVHVLKKLKLQTSQSYILHTKNLPQQAYKYTNIITRRNFRIKTSVRVHYKKEKSLQLTHLVSDPSGVLLQEAVRLEAVFPSYSYKYFKQYKTVCI